MSNKTASCPECQIVFQFEQEDLFAGETFCPICVTRVQKENVFKKEAEAKNKFKEFRIFK
jgi:uncharacterized Zn finger protein (UPF0148 family)